MADLAQIIAGIDGYRNYEQNRAIDLSNQAQDLQNRQQGKIMDLKTQLEAMQTNPYAKWGIWDPQGRRQQLLNEDQQLKIASKWASSIKNLAPEKRAQGYQQFLRAMPTLGIDVSDMPKGYDEAYINQLADLGIETETRYQNEQQNARQERQIEASAAQLERQIAANREARQEAFNNRLSEIDYKKGLADRELQQKIDFINQTQLSEPQKRQAIAGLYGIKFDLENPTNAIDALTSEYLDPATSVERRNEILPEIQGYRQREQELSALMPQGEKKYASGDLGLIQYMVDNGSTPEQAYARVGKMSPTEKLIWEKEKNDITTAGQMRVNEANAQNALNNSLITEALKADNAESQAQRNFDRTLKLEEYKANLPTQKQKEVKAAAQALNIPEADLYKISLDRQQAEINNIRSQIEERKTTPQIVNYQYIQDNPQAAESPLFQSSGTNVTVNTGDTERQTFDQKTLTKESAKKYVQDVDEYNNMLSKMPELLETVDRLKELAKTATYTTTGKVYNRFRQELGRPTEASIARDEYESIIANQILPLLRDTFGAQFTEREGNSLKETLGDPNKSAQSKVKVLDSFINQKVKSLESKYRKIRSYNDQVLEPTAYEQQDEAIVDYLSF